MNKKKKEPAIDFANIELDYEGFRGLAKDGNLSCYEKIGFPDSYRAGFEQNIFEDIVSKLTLLKETSQSVLDIGPGCSELPNLLIGLCNKNKHKLVFCDSQEMLNLHPDLPLLNKVPGMFPKTLPEVQKVEKQFDVILCYSVFHYIFVDTNVWDFLDACLILLKPGGQLLIGDIPNVSKRKRFFASENGKRYHKEFMNTSENPIVEYNKIENKKMDDAVIISLILRAQAAGYNAYLMKQNPALPMATRRDDILIERP
jgi:SAM-dependent methyltransferase